MEAARWQPGMGACKTGGHAGYSHADGNAPAQVDIKPQCDTWVPLFKGGRRVKRDKLPISKQFRPAEFGHKPSVLRLGGREAE